jgi:hypothetical protein
MPAVASQAKSQDQPRIKVVHRRRQRKGQRVDVPNVPQCLTIHILERGIYYVLANTPLGGKSRSTAIRRLSSQEPSGPRNVAQHFSPMPMLRHVAQAAYETEVGEAALSKTLARSGRGRDRDDERPTDELMDVTFFSLSPFFTRAIEAATVGKWRATQSAVPESCRRINYM